MSKKKDLKAGVELVVDAAKSKTALADFLGITRQAVGQWKRVPTEHVPEIEKRYNIPRVLMRPDVYA